MGAAQLPKRERVNYGHSLLKILILIASLGACLEVVTILFQWKDVEQLSEFLRPYSSFLLFASPYLRYFNAAIILILGYFIVGEVGRVIYAYMRGFAGIPPGGTVAMLPKATGVKHAFGFTTRHRL